MRPVVAMITDFGLKDGFVGAMKGVILSINPHVQIVDISHQVEPFQIVQGALLLRAHFSYFPKGTCFLCVVDPGVGSERLPLIVRAGDYTFVGPHNGLFDLALRSIGQSPRAYRIEKYALPAPNQTFHGRDVFAPACAHLTVGLDPLEVGSPVEYSFLLPWEEPFREGQWLVGRVVYFDHFGNCVTNLPCGSYEEGTFRSYRLKVVSHFLQGKKGSPALVCGSFGLMELFLPMDSAKERLGVRLGEEVKVRPASGAPECRDA